jgi:16S rRNA (cytosine967-C5)-methyltransferase
MRPFRQHHALQILSAYDSTLGPLDGFLRRYFLANKAIGSKDRKAIVQWVYALIRWQRLIDFLIAQAQTSKSAEPTEATPWEQRLDWLETHDPRDFFPKKYIPAPIRACLPDELFARLVRSHGDETALEIARISNTEAPTTIRVNRLKCSRKELIQKLSDFGPIETARAPYGITFPTRINLFGMEQFREGLFEMQDEGSQLLSELIEVAPGDHFLDYCAGAGGKSLAIAPRMQGKGQMYLHDIREHALLEAKQRLKRAGVQNFQTVPAGADNLKKMKQRMDWVLVDAPCSGTGTLRRNPEMRERITGESIDRLVGQQRTIFEAALSYLKEGGKIVYATCSVLNEENGEQVDWFLAHYPIELIGTPFISLPTENGPDGFFAAVFQKKKTCYSIS